MRAINDWLMHLTVRWLYRREQWQQGQQYSSGRQGIWEGKDEMYKQNWKTIVICYWKDIKLTIGDINLGYTRSYRPLHGPSSSSCNWLWPLAKVFFCPLGQKELFMLFWCSVETSVIQKYQNLKEKSQKIPKLNKTKSNKKLENIEKKTHYFSWKKIKIKKK